MKVLVTDLDGTLLNSQHEISEENIAALHFAAGKGVEIVIATGRTYANARAICEKAGITAHIISNNGAFVHAKDGKELYAVTIGSKQLEPALRWLHDNGYYYEVSTDFNTYFCLDTRSVLGTDFAAAKALDAALDNKMLDDMVELQLTQVGFTRVDTLEELVRAKQNYCKVLGLSFNKSKRLKAKEYFREYEGLSLITSHPLNFELIGANVSKGNALEYLARHLTIPLDSVVAIGDNYNDISMFEKAGISVAMANAEEDVKKCCTYISLSNDQNGVAHAIQHYQHWL